MDWHGIYIQAQTNWNATLCWVRNIQGFVNTWVIMALTVSSHLNLNLNATQSKIRLKIIELKLTTCSVPPNPSCTWDLIVCITTKIQFSSAERMVWAYHSTLFALCIAHKSHADYDVFFSIIVFSLQTNKSTNFGMSCAVSCCWLFFFGTPFEMRKIAFISHNVGIYRLSVAVRPKNRDSNT